MWGEDGDISTFWLLLYSGLHLNQPEPNVL